MEPEPGRESRLFYSSREQTMPKKDTQADQAAAEATPPAAGDAKQEPAPGVELVHMVRDTPQFKDGPVTADVHPDEVADYSAHDWRVAKD